MMEIKVLWNVINSQGNQEVFSSCQSEYLNGFVDSAGINWFNTIIVYCLQVHRFVFWKNKILNYWHVFKMMGTIETLLINITACI